MPRSASTTSRGYGYRHRQERKRWERAVAAGHVICWRCQHFIRPGEPWDLGHDDLDRRRYRGPECCRCNRSAGARKGNAMRRKRRQTSASTSLHW